MAYWWVSQNKTGDEELTGGYLWAPKENKKGQTFHYWRNMEAVRHGDVIFSYMGQCIRATSVAKGDCYDAERPFSSPAGEGWEREGWQVDITYDFLEPPLEIAPIATQLRKFLPDRYSPLTKDGSGIQGW